MSFIACQAIAGSSSCQSSDVARKSLASGLALSVDLIQGARCTTSHACDSACRSRACSSAPPWLRESNLSSQIPEGVGVTHRSTLRVIICLDSPSLWSCARQPSAHGASRIARRLILNCRFSIFLVLHQMSVTHGRDANANATDVELRFTAFVLAVSRVPVTRTAMSTCDKTGTGVET